MIKKYIILPIILSLFSLLSAGAPDTLWTKTYGGSGFEEGYSVQQTNDGGFVIVGYNGNVYLIRTDSNGDTIWTKAYGGTDVDKGYSVQQTSDGGFIIAGETRSFGSGVEDVYIIRTNSNGDTLWTKTHGGTAWDVGWSVQQASDGGFIIAGVTWSFDVGQSVVYLIRTNSNGDTLWTKLHGEGSYIKAGYSVQQTKDGGFIVGGNSRRSMVANSCEAYLIRTNSNGDTLWTKTYGGDYDDIGWSVQQTNDGGFIIVGWTHSLSADSADSCDFYLIRTNSNGDTLWTKTYGGTRNDYGLSVQQTSDGGFIVVGYTESFGAGQSDVYLIRTNSNGDTLWTNTYGGDSSDVGNSIQQTTDGGYIIAGSTSSFGAGGSDVYLIRLDKDTTAIQQEIPANLINLNNFIVSYNNGNISIRYTLPYSSSVKLEAYDIKGKLVSTIVDKYMNKGSYSVNWDSKRFGSGVYYVKLYTESNSMIRKAIILK